MTPAQLQMGVESIQAVFEKFKIALQLYLQTLEESHV